MTRSILDIQRDKEILFKPVRSASIHTSVTLHIQEDKRYSKEYWTEVRTQANKTFANVTNPKVTIRPTIGGHTIIVNRFNWKWVSSTEEYAILGGRGAHITLRIPIGDWNRLLVKCGGERPQKGE